MSVTEIMQSPAYRKIVDLLDAEHDRTVADIVTLTEIPAPPFAEGPKAAHYLEMLRAHGLESGTQDFKSGAIGIVFFRDRYWNWHPQRKAAAYL